MMSNEKFMSLNISKWGNSMAIRLPKNILDEFNLEEHDKLSVQIVNNKIVLKPENPQTSIQKLLVGYDKNQTYPFDVVDKGGTVGEELI
ncbi:transcriptional regulator/antitoxin, MazE [Paucilactobacillus hokkaidonensis JCM 18461]|uniref:Transcriptional regulator/antitoxin, MazE n=2 Tax=Paucilactobacillus hokkaidonensis TaxID=1193095 RepID=A0A0A1GY07_9LACO|nr:AbrB/MazE/SpoVT family DNA-binding domain-containing protein [Paucilactobacillus hokkaidonensis]KRO10136.1 hypothetical protein IV59_GL002157 [Paucilactobacillus hokkaidonensis]BAP85351.1 transcriptional regulator/antitoxin, MazE [Paucilactobacillus hokkaidonensis JCM 18461]